MTSEQIEYYKSLPYEARKRLPSQIKLHIAMALTGLKASSIQTYPWECPFDCAAEYLSRRQKAVTI